MRTTGQTKLPEILHLQLDNCVKENKCNEFFSFLYYLVYIGAFKEIYVNYCVVGHTHIDIDQVFSRLSVRLRKGHLTLTEFMAAMQESYTYLGRKAEVERVEHVAHWGNAIKGNIVDSINGITEPLMFRFKRKSEEDGSKTIISFKHHCQKAHWKGELDLVSSTVPLPWATVSNNTTLKCYDVAGIRDATGDEIMARFDKSIAPNVDPNRVADVRREWQAFADSEESWAKELCPECTKFRTSVRYVSH
jgi:hypothetical protein